MLWYIWLVFNIHWVFDIYISLKIDIRVNTFNVFNRQKQSFVDVFQNRCSEKFHKFHRKILSSESLFQAIGFLHYWNRDSNTGVFSTKFAKFLRLPIFTEHLRCLLLNKVLNTPLELLGDIFTSKSSHLELSYKKVLPQNLQENTTKKRRVRQSCSSVNFMKFSKTPFSSSNSGGWTKPYLNQITRT